MFIGLSCRAPLVATASLLVALGGAVGFTERPAFAQRTAPKKHKETEKEKKEREKKEADAASAEDEKKKPAEEDEKKKAAAATALSQEEPKEEKREEKKEFDDTVEADKAIYFSGDFAVTRSDLAGLSDNTGFDRTVANGFLYGLSGGLRLKDLRFGLRWRVYDTTEFALWTFALSAGYSLPLRPVTPIFSAHLGYVFDQGIERAVFRSSLPEGNVLPPDIEVKGLLAGLDVNASYWVTKFVRLGAFIGADLMFLSRQKAALPTSIFGAQPELAQNPLYADSGSSIGLNFNVGLRGAFDIGFH